MLMVQYSLICLECDKILFVLNMIKGYATTYINKDGLVCLYFFPGIDSKYNRPILNLEIDQSKNDYKFVKYTDKAIEYVFLNPNIKFIEYKIINLFTKEVKNIREEISNGKI